MSRGGEAELPIIPSYGIEVSALAKVIDGISWSVFGLAFEQVGQVIDAEMHLESLGPGWKACFHLLFDVGDTVTRLVEGFSGQKVHAWCLLWAQ